MTKPKKAKDKPKKAAKIDTSKSSVQAGTASKDLGKVIPVKEVDMVESSAKKPATANLKSPKEPVVLHKTGKKKAKTKLQPTPPKQRNFNYYVWFSLFVLIGTTVFWATLSAKYQLANADQLVNSMLFNNLDSARNALLPNAHSFLIKWPLFFIGGMLGAKSSVLVLLTVTTTLITVCSLAYILYRIEKRPLIIGTIYLILSSFLLLTPTAPYAGALLPVNMAMLATRNIEYILFIAALYYVIRSQTAWRSKAFFISILLLTILFASDKLFVSLSIGGALGIILIYSIARKWKVVQIGRNWLLASAAATAISAGILWLISRLQVVSIVSGGSGLGPYGLVHSVRELIKGSIFAALGLLTNFGANPSYDAMMFREIPQKLRIHLASFSGPGMLMNIGFFSLGIFLTFMLVRATLTTKTPKNKPLSYAPVLSIMLISSSIVSLLAFVVSNHYYPVDSRYQAICFFTIVIAATTYVKSTRPNPKFLLQAGLIISFVTLFSVFGTMQTYKSDIKPLQQYSARNKTIALALKNHHVSYVVGDYWRVIPIAQATNSHPTPSPLANCTAYRNTLTSKNWQPSLNNASFAYILSFDNSATDFPHCSLDDVTKSFGKPNSSAIIAGTADKPTELLLFYDNGKLYSVSSQQNSVLPVPIESIIRPECSKTDLNIVAHQDDDLLFMNPDVQKSITEGNCVRTVYLTAGDAGHSSFYWLKREKGAQAAYSQMTGAPKTDWVERTIKLDDKQFAIMAAPKSDLKISLMYLRLPDGNVGGQGFSGTNSQNISKLHSGQITDITSVDKQSVYTNQQLVGALVKLMELYKPNLIRTQSTMPSVKFPDHADHVGVSVLTQDAYTQYLTTANQDASAVSLSKYYGYPVRELPSNLSIEEQQNKTATFLAYSQNDGAVCHSTHECQNTSTYWNYLSRQYIQK